MFLFPRKHLNLPNMSYFIFFPKFIQITMKFGRFLNHLNINQNNSKLNGKTFCALVHKRPTA
jgi:hypothetical protein